MKVCSVCHTKKDESEFGTRTRSTDGLMAACRSCCRDRQKRWISSPTGKAADKKWRESNRERTRAAIRKNYQKDPAKKHAANKKWLREHPDQAAAIVLRGRLKKYGITQDQYDTLVKAQNGACAICGGGPKDRSSLAIDHCHRSGIVRGLLCLPCNGALGMIGDDNLLKAAEYLAKAKIENNL